MRIRCFLVFLLFLRLSVHAQTFHCGFDQVHRTMQRDKKLLRRETGIEGLLLEQSLLRNQSANRRSSSQVVTIPVVVHVIHNNGPENISDAQVIQGIQWLNDAYSNAGYFNNPGGIDCEIHFCLAQRDPQGNATTGIEHIQSSLTSMTLETDDLTMKALSHWDPLNYLNIYVVASITSLSAGPGVAGYAYFPSSHGNPEDGIVGEYTYFGSTAGAMSVFSHEAGHYLGLYHTFEGGCTNNNCLTDGDRVCDTPPDQSTANIPCTSAMNSCTTDEDDPSLNNPFRSTTLGGLGDQDDLTHDFMDYGNLGCFNIFTPGQKARMQDAVQFARYSLLQSLGCLSPCNNPVTAAFTPSATNASVGTTISFTNTSSANALTHDWSVNGTPVSSALNYSQQFNNAGAYAVTLHVTDNTSLCFDDHTDTVFITCPVQASFTAGDTLIGPGDSVTFTSPLTGLPVFEWLLNGVPAGNANPWTHAFGSLGAYSVQLVAGNGICSDTSDVFYVQVGQSSNNEASWWYFGDDAGMQFTAGGPVALLNNALGFTQEGTACMGDENGQLLFYTDGIVVIDRNHQQMPNGSGLLAGAGTSASQAALILKQPGSNSLYYIFTVDEEAGANGFNYSIVDMTLNNGFGDVTVKNVQVLAQVSEKLTATRHCNGSDFWVVVHGMANNNYYAFQLSATGLNTQPVISPIGQTYTLSGIPNNEPNARGYLKINHTGTKAVAALLGKSMFELFDFDNSTGVLSNLVSAPNNKFLCYGAAFSPDDSKLYISSGQTSQPSRYLFQYDLMAGNGAAIIASEQIISTLPSFGAISSAPDGRLYTTTNFPGDADYLGMVSNPNAPAAQVSYVQHGFYLQGKHGHYGFPNYMSNYFFEPAFSLHGPDTVCTGTAMTFLIRKPFNFPYSFSWLTAQGISVQVLTDSTALLGFPGPGLYSVIVSPQNPCRYDADTLQVFVRTASVALGNDTTTCNNTPVLLSAGPGYLSYLWQDGSTLSTLQALQAGTYWVRVTDSSGCIASDTMHVSHFSTPVLDLGPDTAICESGVVQITAQSGFSHYLWQDGFDQPAYTAYAPGTYWVTVTDTCGVTQADSVVISLREGNAISLGPDTVICDTAAIVLHAGTGFSVYLWQDNSTGSTLTVTDPGTYSVQVTDAAGCISKDSVTVGEKDCSTVIHPTDPPHFLIYPNPSEGAPVIDILQDDPVGDITVTIYDMLGQMVFDRVYHCGSNACAQVLPLQSLAQAVYHLRVETARVHAEKKLMIAR